MKVKYELTSNIQLVEEISFKISKFSKEGKLCQETTINEEQALL